MILIQIISLIIFICLAFIYLIGLLINIAHPLYKVGFVFFVLLMALTVGVTAGSISAIFTSLLLLLLIWHLVMRSIAVKNSCKIQINGYKGIVSLGFLNLIKITPKRYINKYLKEHNLEVSNINELVNLIKKEASGTKIEIKSKGNKVVIEVL